MRNTQDAEATCKNDWLDIIDLSIIYNRFYMTFVSLMSSKYKEVHAAAAEVLGMVLAYMEEKKEVSFIRTSRFLLQLIVWSFYSSSP